MPFVFLLILVQAQKQTAQSWALKTTRLFEKDFKSIKLSWRQSETSWKCGKAWRQVCLGTRVSDRPVPLCSQFFKRHMWNACLPLSDERRRPSSSTIYFGHPSRTKVARPRGPLPLRMGQVPASLSLPVSSPLLSLTLSPAFHASKYISYPLPSPKLFKAHSASWSQEPTPTPPHPRLR